MTWRRALAQVLLAMVIVLALRGVQSIIADGLYYWPW